MSKALRKALHAVIIIVFFVSAVANGEENEFGTIKGRIIAKSTRRQRDTVVYIHMVDGRFPPPEEHAIMDQKNMSFIPHVLPIIMGTTVDFRNSDTIPHNVYSSDEVADKMNLGTWRSGEVRSYTFNKLGVATILCHIHPEMCAYTVVLQNPYFDITKKNGKFSIRNVPAGRHLLKVWNENLKADGLYIEVKKGETVRVNFNLE